MTADEEIIADYERSLKDVREGIQEAVFIIAAVIIFIGFAWVVAAAMGHA